MTRRFRRGVVVVALVGAALALIPPALAQEMPAPLDFDEADHRWAHRLLYIFAPSDTLGAFQATLDRVEAQRSGVDDRDLVVLALPLAGDGQWLGRGALQADVGPRLRARYGVANGDAVVILVGKDGTEKARAPLPADLSALFARIDRMPMRQREMRERR